MANRKKLVFFGAGVVAEKLLARSPDFIVDNDPTVQGTMFHDIPVRSPTVLAGGAADHDVLICTTSISEVRRQLEGYGYVWGTGIQVPDYLRERLDVAALEDTCFSVLISSGLPSAPEDHRGGGVFRITEAGDAPYPVIEKVYAGNTHGLIRDGDGFAVASQEHGIVLLDNRFSVTDTIHLAGVSRPHGLCRYNGGWAYVSSYSDSLVMTDNRGSQIQEFHLSDKFARTGSPQHHCNDLCIIDDTAFVSMFSLSGNWKHGRYDGGVMEINLTTGERQVVVSGLTMPHNITVSDGVLRVLNSFRGEILGGNFEVQFTLPGFVRGFDETPDYLFIGESKNRNFSRLAAGRSPVSIDSRVTVLHKRGGFCRSIPLPTSVSEVHAVIAL